MTLLVSYFSRLMWVLWHFNLIFYGAMGQWVMTQKKILGSLTQNPYDVPNK